MNYNISDRLKAVFRSLIFTIPSLFELLEVIYVILFISSMQKAVQLKTSGTNLSKCLLQILSSIAPALDSWTCFKMHEGTNFVLKATNNINKKSYVIKVYNKASKVDHKLEHTIISELYKKRLYPEVICANNSYRIEKFIEGGTMNSFELRDINKLLQVIESIASLHSNHQLKNQILSLIEDKRPFVLSMNDLWLSTFNKLYPKIRETLRGTKYEAFGNSLNYLQSNCFRKLFNRLIPAKSEVVLSHNDISAANLMQNENSRSGMYLIDYEYCKPNFRGYDLATLIEDITTDYNHTEYPNFKMHPEMALTNNEQEILLKHYIISSGEAKSRNEIEKELTKLKEEVNAMRIVFQLAGVLWGLTTHDWNNKSFGENNS